MPKATVNKWKDKGVFFTLQVMAAFASIAMGKIIAVYFDPVEYGKYFIASSAVGLYLIVSAGPVIQGYRHFHYNVDKKELITFYRSVLSWLSLAVLLIMAALSICGVVPLIVALLATGQVFFHKNAALHQANINIQGKTTVQSIIQVLLPVVNLCLILLIILTVRHADYRALWAALIFTEMTIMIISYAVFKDNRGIVLLPLKAVLRSKQLAGLVQFIKPLLLLPVFAWLVNNADRYLLGIFCSQSEIGLYSAAYSVGGKLFILMSGSIVAFYNAPVYRQAREKGQYKDLYNDSIKRILAYLGLGTVLVILIYSLSDFIGVILLSDQYAPAFALIPALALANLILSTSMLMEQGLYAIGKTRYILFEYVIGALANVSFNLMLIPLYGMWGAALSMILSAILQITVLFIYFKRSLLVQTIAS